MTWLSKIHILFTSVATSIYFIKWNILKFISIKISFDYILTTKHKVYILHFYWVKTLVMGKNIFVITAKRWYFHWKQELVMFCKIKNKKEQKIHELRCTLITQFSFIFEWKNQNSGKQRCVLKLYSFMAKSRLESLEGRKTSINCRFYFCLQFFSTYKLYRVYELNQCTRWKIF